MTIQLKEGSRYSVYWLYWYISTNTNAARRIAALVVREQAPVGEPTRTHTTRHTRIYVAGSSSTATAQQRAGASSRPVKERVEEIEQGGWAWKSEAVRSSDPRGRGGHALGKQAEAPARIACELPAIPLDAASAASAEPAAAGFSPLAAACPPARARILLGCAAVAAGAAATPTPAAGLADAPGPCLKAPVSTV